MSSETKTTITLFAMGILAMIMVFGANIRIDDILSFLYAEISKF